MKLSDKVKSVALGASVLSLTLPASALAAGPVMEEEAIIRVAEEDVEDTPAPILADEEEAEEVEDAEEVEEVEDADETEEVEEIDNADDLLDIEDEEDEEEETVKETPEKETPEKDESKKPEKETNEDKGLFQKFIDSPISLVIIGVALVVVLALSKRK